VGQTVTVVGTGGFGAAITIASGVDGTSIQSSDANPAHFVLQGAPTGELAALYVAGDNSNITINGITATASPTGGGGGHNAVVSGGSLSNVTFENSVFGGPAAQLVYINGAESLGNTAQNGTVNFLNNMFSGNTGNTGLLLGLEAPGTVSGNIFSGTSSVAVGLAESGVTVNNNNFKTVPHDEYIGTPASGYSAPTLEANNSFAGAAAYIIHNGVAEGTVYSSLSDAINAAQNGDKIVEGQSNNGVISNGAAQTITVIRTDTGSFGVATTLDQTGNDFFMLAGGVSTEVELSGAPITAGEFGDFNPIAAVETGTGFELMFEDTKTSQFGAWNLDANGSYVSNAFDIVSGTSAALEQAETTFGQDFNGDGVTGVNAKVIRTDTGTFGVSTSLDQIGNNYFVLAGGATSGPEIELSGAPVTAGEFGDFNPIAAVETAGGGYEVIFEDTKTSQFGAWNLDANGNYVSNAFGIVSGASFQLESAEITFNQDFNGDGVTGLNPTVIKTDGGTTLGTIGNAYVLTTSATSGVELQLSGAPVTVGEFGAFSPIAAIKSGTGYEVVWKGHSQFSAWNVDSNGNYVSNAVGGIVSGTSTALESAETAFNIDFNGDGVIGLYAAPHTTLQISQGAVTIGAGATAEITGADAKPVTFQATTGMLALDHSATFTGQVSGFTGTGAVASSDEFDLKDVKFASATESYNGTSSGGTLTVKDGTTTANISLVGDYTHTTFTLSSDGHNGTIVIDPPATQASAAGAAAANSANLDFSGTYTLANFALPNNGNGMAGLSQAAAAGTGSDAFASSTAAGNQLFDAAQSLLGNTGIAALTVAHGPLVS
jgi:hypothetical protein